MTHAPIPAPATDPRDAAAAAARFAASAAPDVRYAILDTPAGRIVGAMTARGLVRLAYEDLGGGVDTVVEGLAERLSPRILEQPAALDLVARELDEYFAGGRTTFDLPIDWALVTPFARRVLGATARIPYGAVATYGQVAADAGSPGGSRAAGNALGSNPVPIVIPCHRVVRSGGALGGYTGGVARKELLLGIERGGTL
jgi:methylated-DNA-[protein]-cysteine S-methyltransferase